MIIKSRNNVGVLFSGGPAPSANAVISSLAVNLLDNNIPVIGIMRGYEYLQDFNATDPKLRKDAHYGFFTSKIARTRNRAGVFLKTSRANPGRQIKSYDDLKDPEKNLRLKNIIDALEYLNIDALISIGGDDTLKTANFLRLMGVNMIHIPKTIDNDYYGIPWTFGYWTAVNVAQKILLNLRADAQATDSFFIAELMGRKAGWITYAAGLASEAILMISSEDIKDKELDLDNLAEKVCEVIFQRENANKRYGVIAVSEGLVYKLPPEHRPKKVDRHGNLVLSEAKIGALLAERTKEKYKEKTGLNIKITPKQIGYEIRSAQPTGFDVVMGSMLGFGAAKFYQEGQFGVMVSVNDNFDIEKVPFSELIDEKTMLTKLRDVPRGSDFYTLKESLTYHRIIE